jgi:hypothetical protein
MILEAWGWMWGFVADYYQLAGIALALATELVDHRHHAGNTRLRH